MKFVKIPRAIFEFGLKPMDIMVYCSIKSFCNKDSKTVVKAETIAKRIGKEVKSIYKCVPHLEEVGLLKKISRRQLCGKYKNLKAANGYEVANVTGNWIMLDYKIFSYHLLPSQFVSYLYINSCANQSGMSFPSYEQIKSNVHISEETAINAVKVLVDFGLIEVDKAMRVIGCWGHNNYGLKEVFLRVVGYIRKRALQTTVQSICKTLIILIEYINYVFNTYFNLRILHTNLKVKTNFLNRHRYYRRV